MRLIYVFSMTSRARGMASSPGTCDFTSRRRPWFDRKKFEKEKSRKP